MIKKIAFAVALFAAASASAAVPQGTKYDGWCAYGLTKGMKVATDCSINWKNTDGSTYCFSSVEHKNDWAKDITANIALSDAGWSKLAADTQAKAAMNQAADALKTAEKTTTNALKTSNEALSGTTTTTK